MTNDPGCTNKLKRDFAKESTSEISPPQRDNSSTTSQEKKITTTCGAAPGKPLAATGPLQQTFINQNEAYPKFKIIYFNNDDSADCRRFYIYYQSCKTVSC